MAKMIVESRITYKNPRKIDRGFVVLSSQNSYLQLVNDRDGVVRAKVIEHNAACVIVERSIV